MWPGIKSYKNRLYRHEGSGRLYFVEADGNEHGKCRKTADDGSTVDDSSTLTSQDDGRDQRWHQGDEKVLGCAIRLIVPEDQQLRLVEWQHKLMLHFASQGAGRTAQGPSLGHDAQRCVCSVSRLRGLRALNAAAACAQAFQGQGL